MHARRQARGGRTGRRSRRRCVRRRASPGWSTARSTETLSRGNSATLFLCQLLHIGLELVVLILHSVEKQAFGEVGAPFAIVHLRDEMLNFLHHVFERA